MAGMEPLSKNRVVKSQQCIYAKRILLCHSYTLIRLVPVYFAHVNCFSYYILYLFFYRWSSIILAFSGWIYCRNCSVLIMLSDRISFTHGDWEEKDTPIHNCGLIMNQFIRIKKTESRYKTNLQLDPVSIYTIFCAVSYINVFIIRLIFYVLCFLFLGYSNFLISDLTKWSCLTNLFYNLQFLLLWCYKSPEY